MEQPAGCLTDHGRYRAANLNRPPASLIMWSIPRYTPKYQSSRPHGGNPKSTRQNQKYQKGICLHPDFAESGIPAHRQVFSRLRAIARHCPDRSPREHGLSPAEPLCEAKNLTCQGEIGDKENKILSDTHFFQLRIAFDWRLYRLHCRDRRSPLPSRSLQRRASTMGSSAWPSRQVHIPLLSFVSIIP